MSASPEPKLTLIDKVGNSMGVKNMKYATVEVTSWMLAEKCNILAKYGWEIVAVLRLSPSGETKKLLVRTESTTQDKELILLLPSKDLLCGEVYPKELEWNYTRKNV